jgi:hypothetical protein
MGFFGHVDTALYQSYQPNDLRKTCYYSSNGAFIGSYDVSRLMFGGIATEEMYLARAECEARLGNTQDAMTDLNTLLVTRWVSGTFTKYTATSATDALGQILMERRKELAFRGTRWMDLRRLNKDPNYAITLTRNINGQIFTLQPNSPRYVFEIPPDEELLDPLPQNP